MARRFWIRGDAFCSPNGWKGAGTARRFAGRRAGGCFRAASGALRGCAGFAGTDAGGGIRAAGESPFLRSRFFAADGRLLFATENDCDEGRGILGAYDSSAGFRRVGEMFTGGIGPHEAILLRDGKTAAIANGGILTHPDYPRRKLNLAEMSPSLALLELENGGLIERAELPSLLRRLSIRHLTEAADGAVWFGGQYEGPSTDAVELVGIFRRGRGIKTLPARGGLYAGMRQYVGAMAADSSGEIIAATSLRGGRVLFWDARAGKVLESRIIPGACGAARTGDGLVVGGADGKLWRGGEALSQAPGAEWDNHIAAL